MCAAIAAAITKMSFLPVCQVYQENAALTKASGLSTAVAASNWEQKLCEWAKG